MSLASKVRIDYFFDVLSPYAWIGFEALSRYQTVWNVDVRWRPFFLFGVLKKAENLHPPSPAKRDYSRIDIARQLGYYGLKPSFPTSGVAAILAKGSITPLRFLTVLEMQAPNLMETGIREIYLRRWVRNEDIHQIEHIIEISRKIGIPFKEADDMVARIAHPDTKARLTETGNEAIESGAFGAPWINVHTTDGKMHSFWGSDRFHIIAHLIGEKFPGHMRDKAPKYD
uniref:Glutathione S-transferase kappa n=1 Tax=Plectus sambesii TaxID=2011161 RepID=A0A914WYG8_9BILA